MARENIEALKALLAMPFAENLDKSKIANYRGVTSALHTAVLQTEPHCMQYLLEHGFDPNIRLPDGRTLAHLLLNDRRLRKRFSVFAKLDLLLRANVDFDIMQGQVTVFQLAMSRGCYNVAYFLAEYGCVNLHNAGRQLINGSGFGRKGNQ